MLPKCSQNGSKWGPDGLWRPLGGRERFQNRFRTDFEEILGPKMLQNWSKIGQKSTKNQKNTDSKTNFEFDIIFW